MGFLIFFKRVAVLLSVTLLFVHILTSSTKDQIISDYCETSLRIIFSS